MGPLLLLTGVFLHLTRSTHSADLSESGVNVRAGGAVKITCSLDSKVREWRWAPRYPRCVTTGSTEVVINRSSAHSLWDGRLGVTENKRELKLQNTRVNDSGTFYCVDEDNKSSSFNLTVIHDCDPAPVQGSDQLGERMRLSCCGNKPPVTWLRGGNVVDGSRHLRKGVLPIPKLGPEHRGLWSCLDGKGKVLLELCLEVTEEQDAPVTAQTTSAPGGHSARESGVEKGRDDDEGTITCSLDSKVREWRWAPRYPRCVTTVSTEVVIYNPSVRPSWEDAEDTFHGRLVVPENKQELTLLNPRVNDSGTFYCVGEDKSSSSFNLTVINDCNPSPAQGSDQLGQQMKLVCCETKHPVTWLRDGQAVRNSSGLRFFRNGVLTIQKLGLEHRGLWSCLDEEGNVLLELCLEVTEEQDAPATAQTTTAPGGHSTRGADPKSIDPRLVWGIAGVLAAVLFILLMVGIYCCLRRTKMRTGESQKFTGAMENVKPAGSRHGKDEGATGESKTGSTGFQLPQGAEGHEEIHYSLLEFPMAEGRAETPRAPVNGPVYSEVSRKT